MKRVLIFQILVFLLFVSQSFSNSKFGFGFGYPFLSLKYSPIEVKYATGEGIDVFAGRIYCLNLIKKEKIKCFTGIEAGYIKFDTLDMKGTGYEGSLFLGMEYFISKKISFMIDFSPTFIDLKSTDDYEIDGFEMVVNFAIYFYFK